MRIRSRRVLFVALLAALVAALSVWLLWPRTGITRANAMRIEVGMTRAEVEALLGGPARDESAGFTTIDGEVPKSLEPDQLGGFDQDVEVRDQNGQVVFSRPTWQSSHVMILVDFDAEDRVTAKHFVRLRLRSEETIWERLRCWLRL